jgi:hypothetical protein
LLVRRVLEEQQEQDTAVAVLVPRQVQRQRLVRVETVPLVP